MIISYHPTLADAENGTNILASPFVSTNVTVFVRVGKIATNCVDTSVITLNVGAKCVGNFNNNIDGDGSIDCDDRDCPCCDSYAPILNGVDKEEP